MHHKFYYWGEFGFLNLHIINALEYALNKYDDTYTILTYREYGLLLRHLLGNRINSITIDLDLPEYIDEQHRRVGHEYKNNQNLIEFQKSLNINRNLDTLGLIYEDQTISEIIRHDLRYDNYKELSKYRSTPFTAKGPPIKHKRVSISARHRQWRKDKNIRRSAWLYLIDDLRFKYPNCEIVNHGLENEIIKLEGVTRPKNIVESIYYLRTSELCVVVDSGFAHFSLNCATDTFVIGPGYKRYADYNPFGCNLRIVQKNEINQLWPSPLRLL